MNATEARPKVVVSNWVHPEVREFLERHCTVEANPGFEPWLREELASRCADADGLIGFMTDRIDESFLAACPRLKVIACALKGADNFDVEACTRRGVALTIVPDLLTAPTAELTLGLMIGLGRNIRRGDSLIREQSFAGWRPILYGVGLDGASVGLVGMGAVGKAIAHRLRPFRCSVSYFDTRPLSPTQEDSLGVIRASLDRILEDSDFVVLAVPLTTGSFHLIDRAALARMKPGALLINPARGSLVDEVAVSEALLSGHLGGYAADVFECEDWARADRPATIDPGLIAHPATLLTPHIGSAVDKVRREIAMCAAVDALSILAGQPCARQVNAPMREPV